MKMDGRGWVRVNIEGGWMGDQVGELVGELSEY